MILSKGFYDQCSPSYQKVIDELEQKIAELKTRDDQRKTAELAQDDGEASDNGEISEFSYQIKTAILNFAENYLTPGEYWDYCIEEFLGHESDKCIKQCYKINAIGYQHFHLDNELNLLFEPGEDDEIYLKLLDFLHQVDFDDDNYYADEMDISYPHSYLTECFRYFESHTLRLPSVKVLKRYEQMKVLYPKIKAAENDVETWFKLLLEAEDDAFVINNVEFRLGKNLFDTKLWILYIEFLKQNCYFDECLKVYSNYCRFFLEDFDMLEKYKSEMVKYGPVDLHWPNLFEFEYEKDKEDCEMQNGEDEVKGKEYVEDVLSEEDHSLDNECEMQSVEEESSDTEDENIDSNEDQSMDEEEDESMDADAESQNLEVLPLDKQLFQNFYDTYKFQKFPFKQPLMNYILKNANHRILRKLFESCKYFYYKKLTPICYRLDTRGLPKFDSESLTLSNPCNPDLYVKNTFITGSIDVYYTPENGKTFMSKLIPRLSRCDAKYIYLDSQNLTYNEFKFLVSNGQVVQFEMLRGRMKDENNEYIDMEKIMAYLPNIEKLELPKVKFNANTAHALSNQCFNGKIYDFHISSISGEPFDPYEFLKFCVKNRDKDIFWRIYFDKHFNAAFVKQFNEIMTDYKGSCEFTSIVVQFKKYS